jgi:hypothetical protein
MAGFSHVKDTHGRVSYLTVIPKAGFHMAGFDIGSITWQGWT